MGIGKAIADAVESTGATVHRIDKEQCDLTNSAAVNSYIGGLGPIDILVNCAGGVCGQVHHPIEEITDDMWEAVVNANLKSAFYCTRAVAPGMKKKGWGRIVNISSGAGRSVSLTGIQAYTSSKAGQIGFSRQMAHELGPYGITVNNIAPGFVLSNPTSIAQWESYGEDGQKKILDRVATRRLGEPEDIANGVMFFISEKSGWISGQTISIDGGSSMF
ncbi:short-chain dehydrogenase/reductase SDR [Calocera cornea HHB12733]|uniref:3-oxoacyl-[acyl-carrier-protein] reductase n=1 Tax=Calocera cornea HHB12733 TaxID=1353952 RepID=A0A165GXE8_9BASI|nr:short-chain dehydrogenase/reductase SDR [Calocera cornea HHB12733]